MYGKFEAYRHSIFFTKDRVDKGELKIKYCPTYRMVADYFTKPLQGRQFMFMRDIIMGYKDIKELSKYEIPPIKERVVNTIKNVSGEITDLRKFEKNDMTNNEEKTSGTYADVVSGK